jgi:phosphoribosylformylglycinamidine cyclo-ligase
MSSFDYRSAGLNLDLYEEGIAAIAPLAKRTHSPRVLDGFGGFASLFSLENDPKRFGQNYQKPLLVTCTDGVGTKIRVAIMMEKHDTVGIDLVAMSVNDALCTGAEPVLFLDYVVMPEDNPKLLGAIVQGISAGCLQAGCALVGGETAIHPGDLEPGHYDLAGFCVGVVERDQAITGEKIRQGDVVLGLASTGLHSNGYSLARKVVFDHAKLDIDKYISELKATVGSALLEPTRIYVKPVIQALQKYPDAIHGLAHITGGGLVDNIPRVLPKNCQAVLKRGSWPLPPIFPWLQRLGNIEQKEMDRVFNGGIGFVVIAAPNHADSLQRHFQQAQIPTFIIGEVRPGPSEGVFA